MSRRRYISTDISLDGRINKLAREAGDFAVLLYTWMIPHAEDDGSIVGDLDELMLRVMPGRRDKSTEEVGAALTCMAEIGLIVWDREANRIAFPPDSFYKHQSYISEERRNRAAERRTSANNGADERKTPLRSSSSTSSSSRGRGGASFSLKSKFKDKGEAAVAASPAASTTLAILTEAYTNTIGATLTKPLSDVLCEWAERIPPGPAGEAAIGYAFKEAALNTSRPTWRYIESILMRLEEEHWPADPRIKAGPPDKEGEWLERRYRRGKGGTATLGGTSQVTGGEQ